MRRLFLFLGKGGVGKTTSSVSLSYFLADKGYKVFLFSVDPAHNLSDVTGVDLGKKRNVYKGLDALEVDVSGYVEKFLKDTIRKMKKLYKQLSIAGIDSMIDSMKLSPGMEETAVLYAIQELVEIESGNYDYLVVDTPPTGLTLRILALPKLNLDWINVLRMWRLKILSRRRMVAGIKEDAFGRDVPLEEAEDKVLGELGEHSRKMRMMWDLFADPVRCKKMLVVNQDKLSVEEGRRIKNSLKGLGMDLSFVILNKWSTSEALDVKEAFGGLRLFEVPFISGKSQLDREDLLKLASGWAPEVLS